MAEGGKSRSSSDSLSDILSEKMSSSSSDSEMEGGPDKSSMMIPPAPPLPQGPLPLASAAAACAAIAAAGGEMQGLDRLLQKQRNDRMHELRKLKHSERPVSSTDNKERLEKFFAQSSEPISERRQQEVRPDSIRSEVSGLSERRPVSSRLQSNAFRRDLEDIIRGNLVRQERELETAIRLRTAGLTVHQSAPIVGNDAMAQLSETLSQSSVHSSLHSSSVHSGEQWNGGIPVPPSGGLPQHMSPGMQQPPWQQQQNAAPWPQQQQNAAPWQQQQQAFLQWQQFMAMQQSQPWQQQQQQSSPSPASPWQQQAPWQRPPWQQQPYMQQPPWQQRPAGQMQPGLPQQLPPVMPQQPWLVQNRQQLPSQQNPSSSNIAAEITQEHREVIVSEISELVHRQIVSNTMESNFRNRMENLLENRLSSMDHDGIAVMETVRSLPIDPTHRRNDFSHLGIQTPTTTQQSETQMGGASAMAWGGAEFDALRRQMEELQSIVRLSFDLQLDMQRAIRQEVSAALSVRSPQASGDSEDGDNPATSACSQQDNNRPASEGNCLICLDSSVDTVLYQCGHMCVCLSCGMRLKGMGAHCPMCRAPIRDVIRAYRCQQPE